MELWNKLKLYVIGVYTIINVAQGLWQLVSDKPLLTSFSASAFFSRYWLLIISILMFFLIALPPIIDRVKGLEKIYNRRYKNETVTIDGKRFVDCHIENCTIIWNGGKFEFDKVFISTEYLFHTENDAVVLTIALLKEVGVLNPNFAKNIKRVPKGSRK